MGKNNMSPDPVGGRHNSGFKKKTYCTICVAKTKALILICAFVFAYANCWFSDVAAQLNSYKVHMHAWKFLCALYFLKCSFQNYVLIWFGYGVKCQSKFFQSREYTGQLGRNSRPK